MFTPSLCVIQSVSECLLPATISSYINGQHLSTLVDSGSSQSYIHAKTVAVLKLKVEPYKLDVSMALSSLKGKVDGRCNVDITVNGRTYYNVWLGVFDNLCCDVLLGQDFQKRHSRMIIEYDGAESDLVVANKGTCALVAAKVTKTPSLFAHLDPNCRPIAVKSRRYSKNDFLFIKKEIQRLLAEGIIQPSISPWRAQPLVVTNSVTKKKRLCIDFSQTINIYTPLDSYPMSRIEDLVNTLASYTVFSTFDLRQAYHQLPIAECDRKYTAFEAAGKLYEFNRVPFGVTNGGPAFQRNMDSVIEEDNLRDTFPYIDNVTIAGRNQEEHDFNVEKVSGLDEK